MLNHLVQVELIDLAGLELGEAGTHALKQYSQLILVVRGDQLSGTWRGARPSRLNDAQRRRWRTRTESDNGPDW